MFSTSHIHHMLVHFPVALILIGFLAELAALVYKKEICQGCFVNYYSG